MDNVPNSRRPEMQVIQRDEVVLVDVKANGARPHAHVKMRSGHA